MSASSLMVEVLLTKFFGSKLEHHFTFAIISLALFGFGLAGATVHLTPRAFPAGADPMVLSRYAFAYALACMASILIFAWAPLDPLYTDWRGTISLPAFFLLFAIPFGLSGICVSYTLTASTERPPLVYFWDLLGAGAGAMATPWVLEWLGGYGTAVFAAALGLAASVIYRYGVEKRTLVAPLALRLSAFAVLATVVLVYPAWARRSHGLDIASTKYLQLRRVFLEDFGGVAQTYWNAIARIDVSHTASSKDPAFRGGLPRRFDGQALEGRFILVDGGASTRQYIVPRPFSDQPILKGALWAAPYVVRPSTAPAETSLVIGVGGGIDLLIAKAYGVRHVDAIELNPDTYRILLGRQEDPEGLRYADLLRSDGHTEVALYNTEARHFCHAHAAGPIYDVIQASTVDTLTAIQSAGNALSENFLYTEDAVDDYYRLLKPNGILSLTHWFTSPPTLPLRMFATYLDFLDRLGVEGAGKRIVVVANDSWEDAMLKKGEFSQIEVAQIEAWANENGYRLVYHPFIDPSAPPVTPLAALTELPTGQMAADYEHLAKVVFAPFLNPNPELYRPEDVAFVKLGLGDRQERPRVLARLPWDIRPATDERPYFYWIKGQSSGIWGAVDAAWVWPQPAVRAMFLLAVVAALGLLGVPLLRDGRKALIHARSAPFFALSGLGFIFAENAVFEQFTLFVGGPLYSLALVLPSILVGYSLGSLYSHRVGAPGRASRLRLAICYLAGFGLYALVASRGLGAFIGLPPMARLAIAVLVVVPFGGALGLAVPWYMDALKANEKAPLAWMWSVSSAFNVLGSMLFVPICRGLGVTMMLVLSGVLYLLAVAIARPLVPCEMPGTG